MSEEEKVAQVFYKFLADNLCSGYDETFFYPSPTYNRKTETWTPSSWVEEEKADENSKDSCGRGLHLMKIPNPRYVRYSGNAYVAEGEGLLGEDEVKARFKRVRLIRPLAKKEIFFPKANLSYAELYNANLSYANLSHANLSYAKLSNANLSYAKLSHANLYNANPSYADLSNADLYNAELSYADLSHANLYNANLSYAKLSNADLYNAKLYNAKLIEGSLSKSQLKQALNTDKIAWVKKN